MIALFCYQNPPDSQINSGFISDWIKTKIKVIWKMILKSNISKWRVKLVNFSGESGNLWKLISISKYWHIYLSFSYLKIGMEVSNSLIQKMYCKAFQGFKIIFKRGFQLTLQIKYPYCNHLTARRGCLAQEIVRLEKMQSYPVKVRIFWEGHKILRNLHLTFVYSTYRQK